jgi:glycerophosphoryl diester phosphodiesterase
MSLPNNFYISILLLTLSVCCSKVEQGNDDSRLNSKIMILGHMGMGVQFSWPGNSKESILTAIEIGCDGSELDVQMTLDSVLVAYHDQDLNTQSNCNGKIHELNWNDIKNCRLNRSINSGNLVKIEDLFSSIENLQDYYFSFDCKVSRPMSDPMLYKMKFMRAINRLSKKFLMEEHILLEGPIDFLLIGKSLGMKNPLFLISYDKTTPSDTAFACGFFGVSIPKETDESNLIYANNLHLRTMAWSPGNYYENKDLLQKKPDIIQTDDPISLLKLTKRYNYENVRP